MSTTIVWIPQSNPHALNCGNGSTVAAALMKAFGKPPISLDYDDIAILRGMDATDYGSDKPYEQLIEAIELNGGIMVDFK